MRMPEVRNGERFVAERLNLPACQSSHQHFDCSFSAKMQMLADIDFGKPTSSKQACEVIVAKLLSLTFSVVSHRVPRPFRKLDHNSGGRDAWRHSPRKHPHCRGWQ
jgi:hypothetical protein